MTILVAEGMHASGIEKLREKGICVVTPLDDFKKADIEAIVVRSVFQINASSLAQYPRLKLVAKLGTGLDNIDQELCSAKNIRVLDAKAMNSVSTAEFTVMQILGVYKNAHAVYKAVQKNDYRRHLYVGREIANLTAGLIGYGSVGKNIAERLAPFLKKIYIRDKKEEKTFQAGKLHFVSNVDLLLAESDIVILSVDLQGNENMVGSDFLSCLKSSVVLVNSARGALVDEEALISFLKKNPNAFYYCDVLKKEPDYTKAPEEQDYQNPLLDLSNVLFTPHIASLTEECQANIASEITERIIQCLSSHC